MKNKDTLFVRFKDKKNYLFLQLIIKLECIRKSTCYKRKKRDFIQTTSYLNIKWTDGINGERSQEAVTYKPIRKSHSWFKRFGMHLTFWMLLNWFVISQNCNGAYRWNKNFTIHYCEELLTDMVKDSIKYGKCRFQSQETKMPSKMLYFYEGHLECKVLVEY